MNLKDLADLIFPEVKETIADLEAKYPPRKLKEGAYVSRFAPSPTGYLHTGSLFTSLLASKVATQSGGVFYLRLEDTDTKRTLADAGTKLVQELKRFDVEPNEGYLGDHEVGDYGPYAQSERREIYKIVLKHMLAHGLAYPCFCSEHELQELRLVQEQNKVLTGYYGEYAICRHLNVEQAAAKIKAGIPFVIRFRSPGDHKNKIDVYDLIRGKINIAENDQDIVIYKSDGLPTYHLAHVVDDHFMFTNIVVRGEEWISSLPLHYQLFNSLKWNPPAYAHLPVIMKIDETTGNKRKLSKRHDPEAAVSYFLERGYPSAAIIIYLLTIANSNFEEWLLANGIQNYMQFPFSFEKVSLEGALFDLKKLLFYAKEYLASLDAQSFAKAALNYAHEFEPAFEALIKRDQDYFEAIINIERQQEKPRKDYAMFSDVYPAIRFFYDDLYLGLVEENGLVFNPKFSNETLIKVLKSLKATMIYDVDQQLWFNHLSEVGAELGFAPNTKAYKAEPDKYLGTPGDIAEILRIAITTSTKSPSLHQVLQVMGRERVNKRLDLVIERLDQ